MIQSQDKNIMKILGAVQNLPANQHSQSSSFYSITAKLSALVIQLVESKGHPGLLHTNFQHGLISEMECSKMASPLCSNFSYYGIQSTWCVQLNSLCETILHQSASTFIILQPGQLDISVTLVEQLSSGMNKLSPAPTWCA